MAINRKVGWKKKKKSYEVLFEKLSVTQSFHYILLNIKNNAIVFLCFSKKIFSTTFERFAVKTVVSWLK